MQNPTKNGFYLINRKLHANFLLENKDVDKFLQQVLTETNDFIAHYCQVLQEQQAHTKLLREFIRIN